MTMTRDELERAVAEVPAGAYAVGVSGGADSVALLHLLRHHRGDVSVHVVHLEHEMRGAESVRDAEFVRELAERWGVPCTVARLSEIEPRVGAVPENTSARFRAVRHQLFREVVATHGLRAVLLAHHADDQAETVMQRLLRGTHAPYLRGMSKEARVGGLTILRPLLDVTREALRGYLRAAGQAWREDASNASERYLRNRLRRVIGREAGLRGALIAIGEGMQVLRDWVCATAPRLEDRFAVRALQGQPVALAEEGVRRWLIRQGVPRDGVLPSTVASVVAMAVDAASPPRLSLPGEFRILRRGGRVRLLPPGGRPVRPTA
jgi:tRNA(Ile)-lysidine synthetase-like protein